MRPFFIIFITTLFVVPLGFGLREEAPSFSPSPFGQETERVADKQEAEPTQAVAQETPASAAAPFEPASASAEPVPDFTTLVEAEVLRLTNRERVAAGLPALAPGTQLRAIAAAHSADMLVNDYFDHDDLAGCSSSCRATNAGYRWRIIGENIYMMSGYRVSATRTAEMVVEGWMNSPGHRANILGESFTVSGVGVVRDGTAVYVTALYARPR